MAGKIWDDTKKGVDQLGQAVEERGLLGLTGDVASGMWDSLVALGGDCADRGVKCAIPDAVVHGTALDKATVDQLLGDRQAQLEHTTDGAVFAGEVVGSVLTGGIGAAGRKAGVEILEETAEIAGDIGRSRATRTDITPSDELPGDRDPLEVGRVESYGDSKRTPGDGTAHRDHQPSQGALIRRAEELKGEPLTPAEIRRIKNNAQTVTAPGEVHRVGPTYGGRNTPDLQRSDASDLQGAARRDSNDMVDNAERMAPEHVPALRGACDGINCITNEQYDDFLRRQLDE